ncbi:hypothetical protein AY600_08175 [Phormidium willei BDU 130791]|nr:hypothetical protein AY600_08175 [Phormidium willei BDU 130791]
MKVFNGLGFNKIENDLGKQSMLFGLLLVKEERTIFWLYSMSFAKKIKKNYRTFPRAYEAYPERA